MRDLLVTIRFAPRQLYLSALVIFLGGLMAAKALDYQTTQQKNVDRTKHIWFKHSGRWKCALCGAVTRKAELPPPTDDEQWAPETYELPLTEAERSMSRP